MTKASSPFYSIVVSACNIAPYAEEMIQSIQKQTFADYEVILSCEKSSDDTLEQLQRLTANDDRFTIEPLPCSGSASAGRNYGMEHATGTYLLFLDGDDYLPLDTLQCFYDAIQKFGSVDLIAGRSRIQYEIPRPGSEHTTEFGYQIETNRILPAPEAMALLMRRRFLPAVWHQIYRMEILKADPTLRQKVGRRHQDEDWTPRVFLAAKTFLSIPNVVYCYRKRADSVTTKSNPKSMVDITDNLVDFFAYEKTHSIAPQVLASLGRWYLDLLFRYFGENSALRFTRELRESEFRRLMKPTENFRQYCRLALHAGFSKQMLIPLIYLARFHGCFYLCEKLFQKIYWPLFYTLWGQIKQKVRR